MSGENYTVGGNMKVMLLKTLNGKKIKKSYLKRMEMVGGGLRLVNQLIPENIKDLPK